MDLFEFDKTTFRVHPREEVLLLKPFAAIWKRDKSKDKAIALKELSYVWFYCDIRSHFLIIEEDARIAEIVRDVELPKGWKPDKLIGDAVDYYNSHKTILEQMYEGALMAAQTITEVCRSSKDYITKSDDKIVAAQKLNSMLKELPSSMEKLKAAEKQYLRESEEKAGKTKGSQTFNTFEDDL